MLEFLKRRLKSEKGAMDKILVTLLLVIVAIGAVVGLSTYFKGAVTGLEGDVNTSISAAVNDANGSN